MTGTRTRALSQARVLWCLRLVLLRFLSSATFASVVRLSVLLAGSPPPHLFLMFFCLPFFLLFVPLLVRPFARLFFIVFLVVLQRPHLQMSRQLVHKLFLSEHEREFRERRGLQTLLRIVRIEVPDLRPPVGPETTSS